MTNITVDLNKEINNIDISNRNELLKWFMKAYYHNEELSSSFWESVYLLLNPLYKPITEDIETIELKRNIKEGKVNPTQLREALILIGQIMIGVKGKIGVTQDVINDLIKYHSKYNKEFLTNLYMEELNNSIGEEVHITGKHEQENFIENGKVKEVDSCNFVTIDNYDGNIPFVGFKHFIIQIKDKDNKIIYSSPANIDVNELDSPSDINAAKYKILGVKDKSKKAR